MRSESLLVALAAAAARVGGSPMLSRIDAHLQAHIPIIEPLPEHEEEDRRLLDKLQEVYPPGFLPDWRSQRQHGKDMKEDYLLFKASRGNAMRYAELNPRSFLALLRKAEVKPGQTFWDLGSGYGQLVLLAHLYGLNAVGVEMLPSRARLACHALDRLSNSANVTCDNSPGDTASTEPSHVEFYDGLFEDFDFSDADLVLAYSRSFLDSSMEKIAHRAGNMKRMSKLLVQKELHGAGLDVEPHIVNTTDAEQDIFKYCIVRHRRHKAPEAIERTPLCKL